MPLWLRLPPRLLEEVLLFLPRPLPLFLPPWVSLLTVAHAIAFARFEEWLFFADFSIFDAMRFCLLV